MTALTVADFADTGQWRLILKIYTTGIEAFLENTLHSDIKPQLLFTTKWEEDSANLLNHIENAVYDNPRVLDDFSASIILFDRRTLFIPTEVVDEDAPLSEQPDHYFHQLSDIPGNADAVDIYTALYDAEPGDVLVETDGDLTAASSLAPGLKGFLKRTFPGARISTNLMLSLSALRKSGILADGEKGKRMIVQRREKEADFIFLDGVSLISASTHSVSTAEDVLYHLYNIIDAYGFSPADVAIDPEYQLPNLIKCE